MGRGQAGRVDSRFSGPHPAGRFEAVHGQAGPATDEPVPGRHGRAVGEQGGVANHQRGPLGVTDHNGEVTARSPAEQIRHLFPIRVAGLLAGAGLSCQGWASATNRSMTEAGAGRDRRFRRTVRTTTRRATAMATGAKRLNADPPATASRSRGSTSSDSIRRACAEAPDRCRTVRPSRRGAGLVSRVSRSPAEGDTPAWSARSPAEGDTPAWPARSPAEGDTPAWSTGSPAEGEAPAEPLPPPAASVPSVPRIAPPGRPP